MNAMVIHIAVKSKAENNLCDSIDNKAKNLHLKSGDLYIEYLSI